jgi:hypothetical protein
MSLGGTGFARSGALAPPFLAAAGAALNATASKTPAATLREVAFCANFLLTRGF